MARLQSVNPATGENLKTFDVPTDAIVDRKLEQATRAFAEHRWTSFAYRRERMARAGEILERRKEELGRLMTLEMGKPIGAAIQEAEKCAWVCRHYAENAERMLARREVAIQGTRAFVAYQPIGPVLAIMPWNFPFWQVFRFAAPGLMAGNVGLLKHASNVPQCAVAIEEVFREAGFPEGVFQTLLIPSSAVGRVIAHPAVRAVTLTGSDVAGSKVAEEAGRAIKKTVLELGGSDPFIVMPSAELDAAVSTAVKARVINNGQSCIAAKRFFVHESIADKFLAAFVRQMEALVVGDPLDPKTQIGPLATPQILEGVAKQVEDSVRAGARCLTGGKRVGTRGNYYAPTVLTDIPRGAPAYSEEVFGPVALVFRVASLEEAVEKANDSRFGLGSCLWSRDEREQENFIERIEAGLAFVNGMVASDPRLPFGGVKHSGYGRELGEVGIHEFVNIKTVWIAREGGAPAHSGGTE